MLPKILQVMTLIFRIEEDKIISLVAYPKNFITPHGNKQICQSHTDNHQIQKSINFTSSDLIRLELKGGGANKLANNESQLTNQ